MKVAILLLTTILYTNAFYVSNVSKTRATSFLGVKKSQKSDLYDLSNNNSRSEATPVKKKVKGPKRTNKGVASSNKKQAISKDLVNFFKEDDELLSSNYSLEDALLMDSSTSSTSTKTKNVFRKSKKDKIEEKRIMKQQRNAESVVKQEKVINLLEEIQSTLETNNFDLSSFLNLLQQLESFGKSSSQRRLVGDYKMSWVGSEKAIEHIGTGLWKVPLARLQDVFLSVAKAKNLLEVNEVISILGPFPNVRNILQGNFNIFNDVLTVTYSKMIDGTGKEIQPGGGGGNNKNGGGAEADTRKWEMDVLYASEYALLVFVNTATSSYDDSSRRDYHDSDPYADNGANLLLFLKEDDLTIALDKLRVL